MLKVLKACACVVRNNHILAFKHPSAGFQIPKGSVEDHESIEEAVLRELAEESGITDASIGSKVGQLDWLIEAGTTTFVQAEHQEWHIYLVNPNQPVPEAWTHSAFGSKAEEGLLFDFYWQPFAPIPEQFDPVYREVIRMVETHVG